MRALKWEAPRGNAGKPPPRKQEWLAFNGKVSAYHLAHYKDPAHAIPAPLGLSPARPSPVVAMTPAAIAATLVEKGISMVIAQRGAVHALLGLPSDAGTSTDDYLIVHKDAVLSYSSSHKAPNWVSWTTSAENLGASGRSDETWRADPSLPNHLAFMSFHDYEAAGYDPGHLVPSADRTRTARDNARTYITSNTVPQSFNNNRGPWARLENETRRLVKEQDLVAHQLAGGVYGKEPLTIGDKVPVPNATWKIVVFLPRGQTLADVSAQTRVISVVIPNNDVEVSPGASFANFLTTPRQIEHLTGLSFFNTLPQGVADALRDKRDAPPAR